MGDFLMNSSQGSTKGVSLRPQALFAVLNNTCLPHSRGGHIIGSLAVCGQYITGTFALCGKLAY